MDPLNEDELREQWPKDDSGALAARLLQRYLFTLATETALGADCLERAQAESAANKTIAKITKVFGKLLTPATAAAPRKPLAQLHRFTADNPATDQTPEK